MKSLVIVLATAVLGCVMGIAVVLFFLNDTSSENVLSKKAQKKVVVGLSLPAMNIVSEKSHKAFMQTLQKISSLDYEFFIRSADNDFIKMRSQTEDFIDRDVDLICSFGAMCTRFAKEITEKRNKKIPIVFCGVKDPVEANIVASMKSSENHITGVTGISMSLERRFGVMQTLKPHIKKILIVYSPNIDAVERDSCEIKEYFEKQGIEVQKVQVYQTNEIVQKISPFLTDADKPDLLITLRDNIVSPAAQALVSLCNKNGVTFFSYYIDCVEAGAAFGIAEYDETYGNQGAYLAMQIFEDGKLPTEIPIKELDDEFYNLVINEKFLEQQNLSIDPNMMFIMKNTKMIS